MVPTIAVAVGVILAVFGLSGFLFFMMSRKHGAPYVSLEEQVNSIEQAGSKNKPKTKPHKPNNKNQRRDSPKLRKRETSKSRDTSGSRKESSLDRKKTQPSPKPKLEVEPPEGRAPATKVEPVAGAGKSEKRQQRSVAKQVDNPQSQLPPPAPKAPERPKPQVTEDVKREPTPEIKKEPAAAKPVPKSEPKPEPKPEPKKPSANGKAQKSDFANGEKQPKQKSKPKGAAKPTTSFENLRDQVDQIALSEDEMHILIELLLAKRQDNETWQEAGSKTTSTQQLRKKLDDMTEKYEEARSSAEVFAGTVKKLRSDLTALNSRHQSMETSAQNQIDRLRKEKDSLQKRLTKLEEEEKERVQQQQKLQQEQKEKEDSEEPEEDSEEQSSSSQSSPLVQEKLFQEIAHLNERLSKNEAECARMEHENQSLRVSVQEEQAKVVELTKANNTNVQSLRDTSSLVEEENRKLKDQLSKKDIEIADSARKLKANCQQMEAALEVLKEEREKQTSEINEKNFTIQTLETQLQTAKSAAVSTEGKAERVKELEGRVTQLERENEDLLTKSASSQDVLRGLEETLKKENEGHKAEVANLLKEAEGQKEAVARLTALSQELQAANDSLQQKQEPRQALFDPTSLGLSTEALATKEKELQNLRDKLSSLSKMEDQQALIADLTSRNKELEASLEAKNQEQVQVAVVPPPGEGVDGGLLSRLGITAEEIAAKDEELEKLKEKLSTAEKEKKDLEAKVQEFKKKNTDLYDKFWKARDDISDLQKKAKEEASAILRKAEEKVKVAVDTTKKAEQESTKTKLSQLVPEVEVAEEESLEDWLENFVRGVMSVATGPAPADTPSPSPSQNDKMEELEASLRAKEQSEAQLKENVANLTETLQRTRSGLASLQGNVEEKIKDLQCELAETKGLLEKERSSNQSIQVALAQEKARAEKLVEDLDNLKSATSANQMEAGENGDQMEGQNKEQVREEIDAVRKNLPRLASPVPSEETEV